MSVILKVLSCVCEVSIVTKKTGRDERREAISDKVTNASNLKLSLFVLDYFGFWCKMQCSIDTINLHLE